MTITQLGKKKNWIREEIFKMVYLNWVIVGVGHVVPQVVVFSPIVFGRAVPASSESTKQ